MAKADMNDRNATLRQVAASSSCPNDYRVSVFSPCTGGQIVLKGANCNLYSGTVGDFDLVVLFAVSDGGQSSWQFDVWDFDSGSSCFGIRSFRLETPSTDPIGDYCDWNGTDKDCDRGRGAVFET